MIRINLIGSNKRGSFRTARGPMMLINPYPVFQKWNNPIRTERRELSGRTRLRTELRERLRDRGRWPRSWWHPLYEPIFFTDDAHRQKYHDETSKSLRTSVFTLLVFGFFCALTLGAPDADLMSAIAKVKVPFANVDIAFNSFLLVGPLVLMSMLAYVHIFLGHLRRVEPPPAKLQLPVLFNLPYRSARVIAAFLFYGAGPLVMLIFARKAYPRPSGIYFVTLFGVTVIWMLLLLMRRCEPAHRPRRVLWLAAAMAVTVFVCALQVGAMAATRGRRIRPDSTLTLEWIFRASLNLRGANLAHADLSAFDLRGADLSGANLAGADLTDALMTNANLRSANLKGATLTNTDLEGAQR